MIDTSTSTINYPKQSKNNMVEIFVRLRGYTTLPERFEKENQKKKKSSNLDSYSSNKNKTNNNIYKSSRSTNSNFKNNTKTKRTNQTKEDNKNKLIFNYLYYMFTSYPKCNKIAITQDALNGTCIMNSVKNENDLIGINDTILGNASIYEYDNCFCETEDLCDVYLQTIESKINKLFQGVNCCFITCGPSRSGKSYTLFGTVKIKGIIAYTVNKILYMIDYIKNIDINNTETNQNEERENEDIENINNDNHLNTNDNNNLNTNDNNNLNTNEDNNINTNENIDSKSNEINNTNNTNNNENNRIQFIMSLSIEQYYLDKRDILFEENFILEIKYFYSLISQLQQRRRDLAEEYKVQYMESKSNLLLHFTIYKINITENFENILNNKSITELKEDNYIEYFSQFTFIEMNDSLYGFAPASAPSTTLYRESAKTYNDIVNISIKISRNLEPNNLRTNLFNNLCQDLININCHIMILICASPCDPHINVSGNCLIWGYSLRNKINFSKMVNYGFTKITNCPSVYVEDNKFKSNYLDICNFNFEIIDKEFINNYNNEDRPLQISSFKRTNNSNFNEVSTDSNLASKYRDLQKEIENLKKERQLENEKYLEKFKNLEKIIKNIKKNDSDKKDNNKKEDRVKFVKNYE